MCVCVCVCVCVRVALYLYPPSGQHRALNGNTLPLYVYIYKPTHTCAGPQTLPLNKENLAIKHQYN